MITSKQSNIHQFAQQILAKNQHIMTNLQTTSIQAAIKQLKLIYYQLLIPKQKQSSYQQISKLKIIILTNLACAYRKKFKYKVSLFYLKNVQQLQKLIKINDSDSGTTHSNICAIYSEIGKHKQAYLQIIIAIEKLQKCYQLNANKQVLINLMIAYYNCAIQCEYLGQYSLGLDYIEKALNKLLDKNLKQQNLQLYKNLEEGKLRISEKKSRQQTKLISLYNKNQKARTYFKNLFKIDLSIKSIISKQNKSFVVKKKSSKFSLSPNLKNENFSLLIKTKDEKNNESNRKQKNWSNYEPWSNRVNYEYLPHLNKTMKTSQLSNNKQQTHMETNNQSINNNRRSNKKFRKNKFVINK